jgi:hypothetical protein
MMENLRGAIAALLLAANIGLAWAEPVPLATPYSSLPTGEGDPLAITCRTPQVLPGSRLRGPEVCKTNAVWARYRRDGMDVAADGLNDVPAEKMRTINPHACHPLQMGGTGATMGNTITISLVCD